MDQDNLRKGIVPGVIAGYIFLAFVGAGMVPVMDAEGAMTGMEMGNGMLDMVGSMLGADAFIGFILHIIISAVIGALYTAVFAPNVNLGNPLANIVVGGLIYGIIWWILGGNIIMPAVADGDVLQLSIGPSFYGHIIFGHLLAFIVMRDALMSEE
ncbi:MAG: hypothetical protein OXP68_05990 [Anaerolineaceae bacterium]|nr:hypothetical protein [Anaerolineaceae bacterium]MDE0327511.1 hypothetical protein [Anaerolineaceae bacterium]